MKLYVYGTAAVLTTAAVFAATAAVPAAAPPPAAVVAAPVTVLSTPKQKVSYIIGFDVAQSIAAVAPDLDMAAFDRALRNAFEGKEPLISLEDAPRVAQAITERIAARNSQTPVPGPVPEVSREQVGYLVGADIGRALAPIKDEIEIPVMLQAMRTTFDGGTLLIGEAERNTLREAFSNDFRAKAEARAAAVATTNREEGAKFLAENKARKGVFTTPSGLQYMVLRQGAGARPRPTDRVRVHYEGRLLDGTIFDSSYERKQPVDFMLNQVIPGWTEGVSMMPVGAKYRFWIPSQLGYGERGAGAEIGPNATLVFDVELLDIQQ